MIDTDSFFSCLKYARGELIYEQTRGTSFTRDNLRNKSASKASYIFRAWFREICGFVVVVVVVLNLFALDEYRGRSVAKKGPSPSASIRQVFYIGLMRNCRGSPVNSSMRNPFCAPRFDSENDSRERNDSAIYVSRRDNLRPFSILAACFMSFMRRQCTRY